MSSFGALAAIILLSSAASPAFAEDAEASDEADAGEIIVTAQKRSENLLEVPVPVSVLDGSTLLKTANVQLRDFFTQVPGLTIYTRGSGRVSLSIRGISTGILNNPTVAVALDDIPLGSSTAAGIGDAIAPDLDPTDLERIEVLRGPQGTLYGAASLGGLIKYVTKAPDLHEARGRAEGSLSSSAHGDEGYSLRGAVSVPVVPGQLALSVSGFFRRDPGFIDDPKRGKTDVDGVKAYGGRAALLWEPTSTARVRLTATIQDAKADAASAQDLLIDRQPVTDYLQHQRAPNSDGYHLKLRVVSAAADVDLGGVTLTSLTGYSDFSHYAPQDVSRTFGRFTGTFYGLPNQDVVLPNYNRTRRLTQEVRLASSDEGRLTWLIGGFFNREWNFTHQSQQVYDPVTGAQLNVPLMYDGETRGRYTELAVFGDLSYQLADAFDIQLGARYSGNRQRSRAVADGLLNGGFKTSASRSSDNSFTYVVTPRFHLSSDTILYGRVATGYRPGGPNGNTNVPPTYGPDRTTNYEIGLKSELLGDALTLDVSLFNIDWKDVQLRTQLGAFDYKGNGGRARSRGAEASATLRPVKGLVIAGNVTYTDAELTRDTQLGLVGRKGDPLPYAGKWSANVTADQSFAVSDDVAGSVGASLAFVDRRLSEFPYTATVPRYVLPSYTVVDVRAGLVAGPWSADLTVKNIFDKRGFLSAAARDSITRTGQFEVGLTRPRTVSLSIARTF